MTTPTQIPLLATSYQELRQTLIDQLKLKFPNWSDTYSSNYLMAIVELFASLQEQTVAYVNRQARECFLLYAQDPSNVEAHARGRGYQIQYQTPSQVSAMLHLDVALSASLIVPKGYKFDTAVNGLVYEVAKDITLPPSVLTYGPVTLAQQETFAIMGTSTGQPNQVLDLVKTPVMPSTIQLRVDGVLWEQVDHFVDSVSTSLHYRVSVNSNGKATLLFGDGVNGKVPVDGALFSGSYQTSLGQAGAIVSNTLTKGQTLLVDPITSQTINLTAVNANAAVPGSNKETVEQIRVRALNYQRSPRVCLGIPEVEASVKTIPGVEAVKAVNWIENPALPYHVLQVFIAPTGAAKYGVPLDPSLIAAVETLLTETKPVMMGIVPQIGVPVYTPVSYNITLAAKTGYTLSAVENNVATALQNLFDPDIKNIWDFKPAFGQTIYQSQVIMILQQVEGVKGLSMLAPGDVVMGVHQYPQLKTVTINDRVIINNFL